MTDPTKIIRMQVMLERHGERLCAMAGPMGGQGQDVLSIHERYIDNDVLMARFQELAAQISIVTADEDGVEGSLAEPPPEPDASALQLGDGGFSVVVGEMQGMTAAFIADTDRMPVSDTLPLALVAAEYAEDETVQAHFRALVEAVGIVIMRRAANAGVFSKELQ